MVSKGLGNRFGHHKLVWVQIERKQKKLNGFKGFFKSAKEQSNQLVTEVLKILDPESSTDTLTKF